MEENNTQQNKPNNVKGLIIIIAIIAVVIVGYFIIQSFNNNDGDGNGSYISEEDILPLSALNLQGKWERQDGDLKYILNFKSGNELVFTQYDKEGNVTAKSDFGSYEVRDGILNLTITSAGETYADSCNAAVSLEMLIIKTIEGSKLFDGTYVVESETKAELDRLNGMFGSDSTTSTEDEVPNNGGGASNDGDISVPAAFVDCLSMTAEELFDGNVPEADGRNFMAFGSVYYNISLSGYDVIAVYAHDFNQEGEEWLPIGEMLGMEIPIQSILPEKSSYTLGELMVLLGDYISVEAVNHPDMDEISVVYAYIGNCSLELYMGQTISPNEIIDNCSLRLINQLASETVEAGDYNDRSPLINENGTVTIAGYEFGLDITNLECRYVELTNEDIEKIGLLVDMEDLHLVGCGITDISSFANLTKLKKLTIRENKISDMSPIANLTNLTYLSIGVNEITDITPLAKLYNLIELYISDNQITDIGALENLNQLNWLDLSNNPLSENDKNIIHNKYSNIYWLSI